ncbi:hypothetical protein ILYODFUR_015739 [Ilyodon furcidens]|uniref:Uncharacterized protein n=1 Tax=Ilyodon furcidens TaxID=33524 RepID=A0ABV0UKH7_9TELE
MKNGNEEMDGQCLDSDKADWFHLEHRALFFPPSSSSCRGHVEEFFSRHEVFESSRECERKDKKSSSASAL